MDNFPTPHPIFLEQEKIPRGFFQSVFLASHDELKGIFNFFHFFVVNIFIISFRCFFSLLLFYI